MAQLTDIVKAYDVRGIVGDQFDEDTAWALGAAFAEEVASGPGTSRVVIGYDMRPSSPSLSGAFARGAASRGLDVVVIGLCSTDGLYYASGALGAPGAMFTASHNPAAYNGIKMCRSGARPIGQDTGLSRIRDRAQELLDTKAWQLDGGQPDGGRPRTGSVEEQDLLRGYAGHLRGLVDLSAIRPLKIVVDAGNGMGGLTTPAVLGTRAGLPALPLTIVPLYFELDGTFPNHEANPLDPANLRDLQAAVVAEGADLGLAFDGDADRCFVIDERGEPVSPSAITALVARREIAKEVTAGREATVIHNLISSRAVAEVITEAGGIPVRTRVGHSFIKAEMAANDAVFGGEHSAHYYFRDFWFADTGMLAAMHLLAALGEQPAPLSGFASEYERYVSSGEINSRVTDVAAATERVAAAFAGRAGTEVDRLDGLSVVHAGNDGSGPMWWFNLRPSNTEPLLRLNAEAADAQTMAALRDEVLALVRAS
ncbi:MAG: phosphomannomutase [Actinomycetota bacterium]|nr:phosphomannomutase [Actinomycetota bacterium]